MMWTLGNNYSSLEIGSSLGASPLLQFIFGCKNKTFFNHRHLRSTVVIFEFNNFHVTRNCNIFCNVVQLGQLKLDSFWGYVISKGPSSKSLESFTGLSKWKLKGKVLNPHLELPISCCLLLSIGLCVYVCVCVRMGVAVLTKHVPLNRRIFKDIFQNLSFFKYFNFIIF